MRKILLVASICLAGCATTPWQTDKVLKAPPEVPLAHQIEGVPFVEQKSGYCGPATLTMAMNYIGANVSVEQVGPEVYTPGKKGSLQLDLISASRRRGLMAVPIEGMESLVREIAADHPVIVLENLGLSWVPIWHYAILHGYDLPNKKVNMHSGGAKNHRVDMHWFEDAWQRGQYWGLVVMPAGQIAKSADEVEHLRAAAGIEQAQNLVEAEKAYASILAAWPKSLGARIGLANVAYRQNDLKSAVRFLKQAQKEHPGSLAVAHNLEIAQQALKKEHFKKY